ncbi:MAG TPA: rRNA maturation RNase YbeY [Halanaerobiales bacterium]|nr:rRNA maturation RNase YbeY [Halanaerobiales bacterium]
MINLEINNQQGKIKINKELENLLKKIAQKAAKYEKKDEGNISLALVNNEKIKELNKRFRNKDEATDVLSFPMDDKIWGDIIISTEKIIEQAKEYGHSKQRELAYLYTHGILHLLGYDHKTSSEKERMREKEEKILEEVGLERR